MEATRFAAAAALADSALVAIDARDADAALASLRDAVSEIRAIVADRSWIACDAESLDSYVR